MGQIEQQEHRGYWFSTSTVAPLIGSWSLESSFEYGRHARGVADKTSRNNWVSSANIRYSWYIPGTKTTMKFGAGGGYVEREEDGENTEGIWGGVKTKLSINDCLGGAGCDVYGAVGLGEVDFGHDHTVDFQYARSTFTWYPVPRAALALGGNWAQTDDFQEWTWFGRAELQPGAGSPTKLWAEYGQVYISHDHGGSEDGEYVMCGITFMGWAPLPAFTVTETHTLQDFGLDGPMDTSPLAIPRGLW